MRKPPDKQNFVGQSRLWQDSPTYYLLSVRIKERTATRAVPTKIGKIRTAQELNRYEQFLCSLKTESKIGLDVLLYVRPISHFILITYHLSPNSYYLL